MLEQIQLHSYTQATRLLRLTTRLGPDILLAECVRGNESISKGFAFTISTLSTDAAISLRSLLGQPALLELLTTDAVQPRPFHGYLTGLELNGANGGMARYTLTLESWTAFMIGRDSRVFQDQTVFEILDTVFAAYRGRGRLAPEWRYDIAVPANYYKRSLSIQYQESDLAFAERLMSEEGLFYYFEHEGDGASASLGHHTLVVADHNGTFKPNVQPVVRFTQPGAVMKEDSIDRWRSELRLQTNGVELHSWDYRARQSISVAASGTQPESCSLLSRDVMGAYAYSSRSHGERIAANHMQALEVSRETFVAAGTVRTAAPGTTFSLVGHASLELHTSGRAPAFTITRTVHLMHNNLSAELQSEIAKRIGAAPLQLMIEAEQNSSLHSLGTNAGERPLYRNRFDAVPASLPYRARRVDDTGALLYPRPRITGQQTAVVVGPPGAVIHTDRDHRVKVQFHWQRGDASHSRLAHPRPEGHTGAPGDDSAGTWVRVMTSLASIAGANWGAHAVPRVGQEVLIDFLDGDIERPVVIGALYNGKGRADGQDNQIAQGGGGATGNAPAWFPGDAGAHAHPAVLSGLKSQAMSASQSGSGAYSQLVFDDSAGQARVALQNHASAHRGTAELNMGHLRHQSDNQRLGSAGFGAEMKTEHSAALRAGNGMLLSTYAQSGASGSQLDTREAHAQNEASLRLQELLASTAVKHNATLPGEGATLPAISQMALGAEILTRIVPAADADVTAFGEPLLQLSAPAGITATTPASAIISAKESTSITAGQDINVSSQGNLMHAVKSGVSLFTYGKASADGKPNQETGIRMHAASGKVSAQSQAGETRFTADKAITVASVTKSVVVAAKQHVLLTAQGAYLKLEGGNISIHGPGKMEFKASKKELAGPASIGLALPNLPKSQDMIDTAEQPFFSQQINASHYIGLFPEFAGLPYQVWQKDKDIQLAAGQLDPAGLSARIFTDSAEDLSIIVGDASWEIITPEQQEPESEKEN